MSGSELLVTRESAPKISVITVVYNAKDTIEDTILSVASQDYPNVEHVIIDGGSDDGTLEIIKNHTQSIAKVISEPDEGIYDAMNKGILLSEGEIIGFLNSDDFYEHSHVLTEVAERFKEDIDACYGDVVFVKRDNPRRILRCWRPGLYKPGNARKGWMPPHPTFFARRKVYERCGLFDTRFDYQADVEMMVRLFEKYHIRSSYIPEVLVRMRMGGASTGSLKGVIRGNYEAWNAAKKHGLRRPLLFVLRKVLSRMPQFFSRPNKNGGHLRA